MTRPPDKHAFCADYARAAGDPLAGTGVHQVRNILIQWPKRHWRHSLRVATAMSDDLVNEIENSVNLGWRVNLIDRKPHTTDTLRVYVFPDAVAFDVPPNDVPDLLRAITDGTSDTFTPRPLKRPIIVCCTHGKHDRCCAKFGFASYKAIAAAAADRVSIWEITHLGGCRLAASVMAFPQMHKYGRIGVSDATPLIEATLTGTPYLPRYRGASHLAPPEQVADLTVLQTLAKDGLYGPVTLTQVRRSDDQVLYLFTSERLSGEVEATAMQVSSFGSCDDLETDHAPDTKTVWHAKIRHHF